MALHLLLRFKKLIMHGQMEARRKILAGWNDVIWLVSQIQTKAINFTAA